MPSLNRNTLKIHMAAGIMREHNYSSQNVVIYCSAYMRNSWHCGCQLLPITAKEWQGFITASISHSVRCTTGSNTNSIAWGIQDAPFLLSSVQAPAGPFWGGQEALSVRTQRGGASKLWDVDMEVGCGWYTLTSSSLRWAYPGMCKYPPSWGGVRSSQGFCQENESPAQFPRPHPP